MLSIAGQSALITGSSRGMGPGIALKLAECGVRKVAVHYLKNHEAAEATANQLREHGADHCSSRDITKLDDIARMFDAVRTKFGTLDIFVSNARPEIEHFYQPVMQISLENWQTAFNSQSRALLVAVREAVKIMPDGGRIVAVTYAQGHVRNVAALGGHGISQGGDGVAVPLLRGCTRSARDHCEYGQPRCN